MQTENRPRKAAQRTSPAAKAAVVRKPKRKPGAEAAPAPTPVEETSEASPGETIAHHRHARGMTLAALSELSSVAISTISRIENGRISPTYSVLSRLAKALDIRWPDMVGGNEKSFAQGCRAVSRAGHGVKHPTSTGIFEWLGADLVTKSMEPTLIEASADTGKHVLSAHDGQEFIYVTDGSLIFMMRDYAPLMLEKGDSVYFDAATPHACYGVKMPARYLSIVAKP
ncbi:MULTISPECIES: helix-turn-helix domain-containing protein [unclassified Caballeronia]|uniref:helix-turn-helix domain-containing protein n=1 Tax=unclassified Caballeronia TaxID=2646786 RepID=UPI002028F51D|nr:MULTISPECIES: XRE family transcriptional regulator [unclassified Caballeronia]MDR5805726.1 XRE family transcriptional regulator [Caballeronia sp. LZ001]